MPYVIHSPTIGTYITQVRDLMVFSRFGTLGETKAMELKTPEKAQQICDYLAIYADDLEVVEVKSSHWRHLKEAGLDYGNMADNELRGVKLSSIC